MSRLPTVSVIIPFYNGAQFLGEAVQSALAQSYLDKEVIVVNDGCNDASASQLAAFEGKIKIIEQANQGVSAARNSGLEKATGKYVAFLDSDDYWSETFLEKMVCHAERQQTKITYCGWQHVGNYKDLRPFVPPDYEQMPDKRELLFRSARWPIHAVLVERDLILSVGGFENGRRYCEDFQVWLKIALNHTISLVPEVLAYYRHHGNDQSTANRAEMLLQHLKVQQRFMKEHQQALAGISRGALRRHSLGQLLSKAYDAYWQGDLMTARAAFRTVMLNCYGSLRDWLYMLPSVLPVSWHRRLIMLRRQTSA